MWIDQDSWRRGADRSAQRLADQSAATRGALQLGEPLLQSLGAFDALRNGRRGG